MAEVGRGGMGVVYRARHVASGAEHALKVLSSGLAADPEALVRFRREAASLARVAGEGVVAIHDAGVDAGRLWFSMELMPGGSLTDRLRLRGALPWDEALAIVKVIGAALTRCHEAGIVHRDLKPANVLFDREGRPAVTDFGLARDLAAASLTETGSLLGTPDYMAPEQLEGGRADARADVYALGAILHELLTGAHPFRERSSIVRMLTERRGGVARPPSTSNATVPAAADEAVARALAPQPADRFASVAELLAALEGGNDGGGARRSRGLLVASGAVLAVASASALLLVVSRGAPVTKTPAPPPVSIAKPAPAAPRAPTYLELLAKGDEASVAALGSRAEMEPEEPERRELVRAAVDAFAVLRARGLAAFERCCGIYVALVELQAPDEANALWPALLEWARQLERAGGDISGYVIWTIAENCPLDGYTDEDMPRLYALADRVVGDFDIALDAVDHYPKARSEASLVSAIKARLYARSGDIERALDLLVAIRRTGSAPSAAYNVTRDVHRVLVERRPWPRRASLLAYLERTILAEEDLARDLRWVRAFVLLGDDPTGAGLSAEERRRVRGDLETAERYFPDERAWWALDALGRLLEREEPAAARTAIERRDQLLWQPAR